MAKYVLLDTGFWYALYDSRDMHHEEAMILADERALDNFMLPWPCLYETLNTRFVRRREWLRSFRGLVRRQNVRMLADGPYRERALASVLEQGRASICLSLVDTVIREILRDLSVRVDAIVTFNDRDFADLCAKRNIEMVRG